MDISPLFPTKLSALQSGSRIVEKSSIWKTFKVSLCQSSMQHPKDGLKFLSSTHYIRSNLINFNFKCYRYWIMENTSQDWQTHSLTGLKLRTGKIESMVLVFLLWKETNERDLLYIIVEMETFQRQSKPLILSYVLQQLVKYRRKFLSYFKKP